jgi:ABC-type multidrug transport system fused ATPase/permease subunit
LRDQTFHGLLELCLIAGLLAAWVVQVDASLVPVLLVLPLAYHNLYCAWQEWSLLKWTRQAWQRVRLLVELESQVQGDTPLLPGPQALALESAGFDHSGSAVLDAVQACFQPGTHTVIVGRNGAGKSTLLMVLARLYDRGVGAAVGRNAVMRPRWRHGVARRCRDAGHRTATRHFAGEPFAGARRRGR